MVGLDRGMVVRIGGRGVRWEHGCAGRGMIRLWCGCAGRKVW